MSITVGFIGLGEMGSRMADNLLKSGFPLHIHNRTAQKATELIEKGAKFHDTPKELAKHCDVIISMVRDDDASRKIWLDEENGAASSMRQGAIAIECSTISHEWTLELHHSLGRQNTEFLEAPLAGTLPQADAGDLVFFVAGKKKCLEKCKSVFEAIGKKTVLFDTPGQGAALKLCVNSLFAIQTSSFAEWIFTLKKKGFENEKLGSILKSLPVTSPIMNSIIDQIVGENFQPMFPVHLVAKDLIYAQHLLARSGIPSSQTKAAEKAFSDANNRGFGRLNISGVSKAYRDKV